MSDSIGVRTIVSIVTWRAAALTIQCLEALALEIHRTPGTRVIVVDNDSQDGTAEAIEQAAVAGGWGGWLELIRAPRNGGFSYGNNIAIRNGLERFPEFDRILLLNPDTIIRPGAITFLSSFLDSHADAAVVGGRCEDPDGTPQECAFRFPGIVSEFAAQIRLGAFDRVFRGHLVTTGHHDVPVMVDWVTGALMMIRREALEQVGYLDEAYFLYYEETDLMYRMSQAGWKTWHVPASRAVHLVGKITGVQWTSDQPRRLPAYVYESRRRYFVLNMGLAYAIAVDIVVLLGQVLWKIRQIMEGKRGARCLHWGRDFFNLGVLRKGRRDMPARITR